MAAAMVMMIIAIKIHTVDRRPVAQAGITQEVYDVTGPATLEALESWGAQGRMTQYNTMEDRSAAGARWSPANGPGWLGMSDRGPLGEVAMRQSKPRMVHGTGGSDEGGNGTRQCTGEGEEARAGNLSAAAGTWWPGMSNREQHWVVSMGRIEPQTAYETGGSDEGGRGTRQCAGEGGEAMAGRLSAAAGTWWLGMSNREQHWVVSMRRIKPQTTPGSGGPDGGGDGTRRCAGGGRRRSSCRFEPGRWNRGTRVLRL
jgi:hypothetical protein